MRRVGIHPGHVMAQLLRYFSAPRVLALALALRVIWILLCPNEPVSDQGIYHQAAVDLAAGRGYVDGSGQPAGFWPVGYPALLAPFYCLFGSHYAVAFTVNAGLGLLSVWGAMRLSEELFGSVAGNLAGLVAAVLPTLVMYTTCIASENAVLPSVLWVTWLVVRVVKRRLPWPYALLAGVLLGVSAYVRATVLVVVLVLPLLGWLHGWTRRKIVAHTAIFAAATFAVLVPWAMRNQVQFGKFSLTSLNGGANLWMGNHEGSSGTAAPFPKYVHGLSLVEREQVLSQRAREFIVAQPAEYVRLSLRRVWITLRSDTIAAVWNVTGITKTFGLRSLIGFKGLCTGAYFLLWIAAATAVIQRHRRKALGAPDILIAALLALIAVPFAFIVGGNRYQLPMQPLLVSWVGSLAALPALTENGERGKAGQHAAQPI